MSMSRLKKSALFRKTLARPEGGPGPVTRVLEKGEPVRDLTWETRDELRGFAGRRGVTVFVPGELPETGLRKALEVFCPEERVVWSPGARTGGCRPLFGARYDRATISKVKVPEPRRGQGARLFLKALRELLAQGDPVAFARADKGQATLVRQPGGRWGSVLEGTGVR